jgi:hypothetical protein
MPLKEVYWICPCGTHMRYWDRTRQTQHEKTKKHIQWENDGVVFEFKDMRRHKEIVFTVERFPVVE